MKSFLPANLHKDVLAINYPTDLTKKQIESIKEKSLILCSEILWYILTYGDIFEFISIPFSYMDFYVKNYKYTQAIIKGLSDTNILIPLLNKDGNSSYCAGNGKQKAFATKYKFNIKYFNDIFNIAVNNFKGKYIHIDYINKELNNQSINQISKPYPMIGKTFTNNSPKQRPITEEQAKKITKKMTKIEEKTKQNISEITIPSIVLSELKNYKIDETKIYINDEAILMSIKDSIELGDSDSIYPVWRGIKWLYTESQLFGTDLIVYKDKAYLEIKDSFIRRKTISSQIHMSHTIEQLNNKQNIYSKRNLTNNRLDTNITNMKSDLRKKIQIDGENMSEIDLSNSQFAILSYLYPSKCDKDFVTFSKNGTLYQYIGDKLYPEIKDEKKRRTKGKKLMILTAFSPSEKWQTPLRKLFPKTMQLIDKSKEFDYTTFSINLQKKESEIIIDGLLPFLQKNYKVLTIHDAILVKNSEKEKLKIIIDDYFKSLGFECKTTLK